MVPRDIADIKLLFKLDMLDSIASMAELILASVSKVNDASIKFIVSRTAVMRASTAVMRASTAVMRASSVKLRSCLVTNMAIF